MPLVCVCSPKGGTGKTTLTANLASSFARMGIKALAVDFDVQNALRLHFGVPLSDGSGYVIQSAQSTDWSQAIYSPGGNISLLPYGEVSEQQRLAFEHSLIHERQFCQRGLNTLLTYPELIIIADFPPGPGAALQAVGALADLHLITLLADTASASLLPRIENQRLNGRLGNYLVLNQSDSRRAVSRDVTAFIEQRLDERLIGVIHRDESVIEANASQKFIFDFSPMSAAAFDIDSIAKKVAVSLNVQVGNSAY